MKKINSEYKVINHIDIEMNIITKTTILDRVYCANCGGVGHIHKNCNHPITSYGIICFHIVNGIIRFIMVQRKDSLSYIEFLRGKYALNQKQYILKLFENMTISEREAIKNEDFSILWKKLWQIDRSKNFVKEYNDAKSKFEILKKGYNMKMNQQNSPLIYFNIDYILLNTKSVLGEPEWGFPKGRRNINENDFSCALREFYEETNIPSKYIHMLKHPPYEEVFTGSNNIRYRHIYYLAYYNCNDTSYLFVNPLNKLQSREIKDIKSFEYIQAQTKIRNHNIERKELLKRVNNNIIKMFSHL